MAGHINVSDSGRATTCGLEFKAPSLETKSSKNEGSFENMSSSKKPFQVFNEKKLYQKNGTESKLIAPKTPANEEN